MCDGLGIFRFERLSLCRALLGCALAWIYSAAAAQEMAGCSTRVQAEPLTFREALTNATEMNPKLIIVRQELEKARAAILASKTPFLPSANLSLQGERFVDKNVGNNNVVVVGSNVVGGRGSAYSNYASAGVNMNLYNGGKDTAAYEGAQAGERASAADLADQADETLSAVITSYADLMKAQSSLEYSRRSLELLKKIEARAVQRLAQKTDTRMTVNEARRNIENVQRDSLKACQDLIEQSGRLAQAMGRRLQPGRVFRLTEPVPDAPVVVWRDDTVDRIVQHDPAVQAAAERLTAARQKLKQARAGYYPTVTLAGRYDWLGSRPDSYDEAFEQTRANSYRLGLALQQSLFPFTSVNAAVDTAQAEIIQAEAKYRQAILDVETRLRNAINAKLMTDMSKESAQRSLDAAREDTRLAEALFARGRVDLDARDNAELTETKEQQIAEGFSLDAYRDTWLAYRALQADEFAPALLRAAGIAERAP